MKEGQKFDKYSDMGRKADSVLGRETVRQRPKIVLYVIFLESGDAGRPQGSYPGHPYLKMG